MDKTSKNLKKIVFWVPVAIGKKSKLSKKHKKSLFFSNLCGCQKGGFEKIHEISKKRHYLTIGKMS